MNKSKKTWITCGIIAIIFLCGGGLLLTGGLGALVAIFGQEPEGLGMNVESPPTVNVSEEFQIAVMLTNQGTETLEITEIQIPNNLLESAVLNSVTPSYNSEMDYGDQTGYAFNLAIEPGGSQQVIFNMYAVAAGDYSGDVQVNVGTRSKIKSMRIVINQTNVVPENPSPENSSASSDIEIPYESVVQILALVDMEGRLEVGWTGSGSVISPDGIILTNAHVALSDRYFKVEALGISMTVAPDQDPVPTYLAEVVQADEAMDIAVLRIIADKDGNPIDPGTLNLPYVQLGNSDQLELGESIRIVGYPGIGGGTITVTDGVVSGFTAQEEYGNRAFIKTSATISGGNSGGLATNQKGEIIGVPTQLGYGGDDQYVDCRVLVDTNRDGYVDEADNCVPTGGFINALRPITLAKPLIDAAQQGQVHIAEGSSMGTEYTPSGTIVFQDDFSNPDSGWETGAWESGSISYQNGMLQIEVLKENHLIWNTIGEYSNSIISVDTQVTKPAGDGDYGVICNYIDADNFYGFEISEDGYYIIYKYENGEFISILPDGWEYSELIQSGQPARLTATCANNTLSLAVNNTLLAQATDTSFNSGYVGVIAGTYENGPVTVGFDNFVIHTP